MSFDLEKKNMKESEDKKRELQEGNNMLFPEEIKIAYFK